MKVNQGFFLAIAIILLPISYTIDGYLSYYDEIFVLFYLIYGLFFDFKKLFYRHKWLLLFILLFFCIGITSNYLSNVIPISFSVVIDLFTIFKPFVIFLILSSVVTERDRDTFIKTLVNLSKIYVVTSFLFALTSQFLDINMTDGNRYGFESFYFLSANHSGFGITIILCLLILASASVRKRVFFTYFLIAFFPLFLTTKGVIYIFILFFVIIYVFSVKGSVRKRDFIMLFSSLLVISSYQINEYLLNYESPRLVLIATSYDIAKKYYPLGSGFSTFGSSQAQVNYSPLYKKYKFDSLYGLSKKNPIFLNDNYIAMILAQTGFFGLLLYFFIMLNIFVKINTSININRLLKSTMLAVLFMLYISSIATGIIKTANGVMLFAVVAILHSNTISKKRIEKKYN